MIRTLLLFALLPAGCSAFGPEAELCIALPALPEHWSRAFPGLGALIVFPDSTGRMREVDASSWETTAAISCPKTGVTPILAYPCAAGDCGSPRGGYGHLRPAGGLYPFSLRGGGDRPSLELTWEDGAACRVLSLLRSHGTDCSLFSIRRLCTYMRRRADPWDLDLEGIAEKIARGNFTAYDIDSLPARNQLVRPGPGEWFLESPFCPLLGPDAQGAVMLNGLPDGMHALFSVEGRRLRIVSSIAGVLVFGDR
jgi:hypothetical protein